MNDPAAACELAYGTSFRRYCDDPVSLTIWAYARHSPWFDGFMVGFRVDHLHDDMPESDADSVLYANPAQAAWYGTAEQATTAAHTSMAFLAGGYTDAVKQCAEPEWVDQWFAWDGVLA